MLKGSALHEELIKVYRVFKVRGDVHTHRFDVYLHSNAKHDEQFEVSDSSIYCSRSTSTADYNIPCLQYVLPLSILSKPRGEREAWQRPERSRRSTNPRMTLLRSCTFRIHRKLQSKLSPESLDILRVSHLILPIGKAIVFAFPPPLPIPHPHCPTFGDQGHPQGPSESNLCLLKTD